MSSSEPDSDITRLIVIPLSFLRRLDSLKYTSIIALFSIAYLVILVVAHYIRGDTLAGRGTVRVFEWAGPVSALAAFPVIVFAYTCHQNVSTSHGLNLAQRDRGQLTLPHNLRHLRLHRRCLQSLHPHWHHRLPILR
jgi:hypothetical protein